jgi:hypothetical protein
MFLSRFGINNGFEELVHLSQEQELTLKRRVFLSRDQILMNATFLERGDNVLEKYRVSREALHDDVTGVIT